MAQRSPRQRGSDATYAARSAKTRRVSAPLRAALHDGGDVPRPRCCPGDVGHLGAQRVRSREQLAEVDAEAVAVLPVRGPGEADRTAVEAPDDAADGVAGEPRRERAGRAAGGDAAER